MENSQNSEISWVIKEYDEVEHTRLWYAVAGVIGAAFLIFAFMTDNILFSFITILGGFLIYLQKKNQPKNIRVTIDGNGVRIGRTFYDYDEMKNFVIIYKPKIEVRNLYVEFGNIFKHRLTIPLENMNPLPIREKLLKYIPENLNRINPPFSEGIAKLLRL